MDCSTARLLLDYARPRRGDLEPAEAEELERHLGRCLECDALARTARGVDEHLGRAMRQVEIPDGLRTQLLARLDAERGRWYRQRFGHGLRALAAAAALFLVGWGVWRWYEPRKPEVDPEAFYGDAVASRDVQDVQASLQQLGVDTPLPENLNYNFLTALGVTELAGHPGQKVPLLVFSQPTHHNLALVYVIPGKKFNLDRLKTTPEVSGSRFRFVVVPPEGQDCALLILYTGEDVNWLNPPQPDAT